MYRTWCLLAAVSIQVYEVDEVAGRGETLRASAVCRQSHHDTAESLEDSNVYT